MTFKSIPEAQASALTPNDSLAVTRDEQYAIARIDAAEMALIEASTVPDVKDIRDKAESIRTYLKQQSGSLRVQNHAAVLKLRAERKLGEIVRDAEKNPGGPERVRSHGVTAPTYSDLGIEKMAAHRWQTIALIPEPQFEAYVEQAETTDRELTSSEAYRMGRQLDRQAEPAIAEPLPAGRYSTIEADPPWQLDAAEAKSAVMQYELMDIDAICAMGDDVIDRAADDCTLWLWAINPMLPEALTVMEAWGFAYKGCLTWVKPNGFGTGHYLRGATEHVLLGVRGTPTLLRKNQPTYFEAPRIGRHSEKPAEFYDLLESLTPAPRIRLFARSQRDGWDSWGNEL